jgi:hypothetical protein
LIAERDCLPDDREEHRSMSLVRAWLPLSIIASGLVVAIATGFSETGVEGCTLLVAAGLSVWLLNWLYRFGVRGERERDDEDHARAFFDEHGYWPDEDPSAHA